MSVGKALADLEPASVEVALPTGIFPPPALSWFSVIIPRMKFAAFAFISGVESGSAKDIARQFALILPNHQAGEREECADGGRR